MPENASELVRMSFLQWLENEEADRQQKYRMFRDYYDGEHETQLTARQQRFLELKSGQEFNLNFCPLVVDALAERLRVIGFSSTDEKLGELIWQWWQQSRMDGVQGVAHRAGVRDGDTYLIVEWDNEAKRPRFYHENAYDGTSGVQIIYSDERRTEPLAAIKKWIIEKGRGVAVRRGNVYYPDRIKKYQAMGEGSWQQFDEAPWVQDTGQPIGVPVMHFRNKDQGYSYGESELEDVTPPQNWLNKTALDLVAAADQTAFQIPYMTGGKPENMSFAIGSWVYTTDKDAKVGTLSAGDLDGLRTLKDSIAADIAKITRTPLAYFQISGQVAAEGTLKQQESGLVGKARDRQVSFGNTWEDAMRMAVRLHNTWGKGVLDADASIECTWADPETRNEKEHLESVQAKQALGVPQETLWAELGYSADAIKQMKEQAAQEQVERTQSLGEALLNQEREFNGKLRE